MLAKNAKDTYGLILGRNILINIGFNILNEKQQTYVAWYPSKHGT
jgi:hypothetical protein